MSKLTGRQIDGTAVPDAIEKMRKGKKTLIIVGLCLIVFVLLLLSPVFNVTEVRVTGNSVLTAESVISGSGIAQGVNIFKLDTAKAEKRLGTMAYIDSARVVRRFPTVVEIQITENSEVAYVYFIGNYVGIDENGKILEIKSKDDVIEKPVILGTNVTEFGIGSHIKIDDEKKEKAVFTIIKQVEINQMGSMLKTIDVADLNDIKIFTVSESTVNMGSMDDIIYKIAFLKEILEEPGDKRGAVIDMTNPEKVTYRGS